ncbi:MAG: NADPH-dependent glutamate synthase [Candidatus Lokiarchaeota archaeon]|nr:NADPH-dependent glutamate synthase [Candidatus Lokiarchaeota archaeon]
MTEPQSKKTTRKKKVILPRHKIPEQDPFLRSKNFDEVNLGYAPEMAQAEASRCLQCPKPACREGCPVNVDIPGFIKLIIEGNFIEASHHIKETNALPAICGRVCPQETQCEGVCVLGKSSKYKPVAIGNLERFVADAERATKACYICEKDPPTGKKVAIIGSGPAGLTVAGDLIKKGHEVHIFEAFHKGGGVLVYGIPEFRLPKEIVNWEIQELLENGVEMHYNTVVGKLLTVEDLKKQNFDAIFIGIGAGLPLFMGIPGENLKGVVSANEYLTRSNLMKSYDFPNYKTPPLQGKKVVVVGGGNVAMDSARTALRLESETVTIVYRRAMEQLPARVEEVHHAQEEGVIFNLLTNPVRFIGDATGRLQEVEVLKMKLGEPDSSGRARPIPIEGSEFQIPCDLAIIAIGNNSNPLLTSTMPDLKLNKWGNIITDENGATNLPGIYAGGDIVTGAATVISAMGEARRAAKAIHEFLRK